MWASQNGSAKYHSSLPLVRTAWSLGSNAGFSFHFCIVKNKSRLPDHTAADRGVGVIRDSLGNHSGCEQSTGSRLEHDSQHFSTVTDTLLCQAFQFISLSWAPPLTHGDNSNTRYLSGRDFRNVSKVLVYCIPLFRRSYMTHDSIISHKIC